MRSRRLLHVTAVVAAVGVAAGQPQPKGKPADPKPAGSSPTESSDVPDWRAGPARFAVAPFENHATGVRAFDWLIAGAPFEIAEKTEAVVGLDPVGGPLYIHDLVPGEAPAVADYATQHDATYVITGWVERPNWETRIDATLWRVTNGVAAVVSEAQRTGPDATYHKLLGDVIAEIWTKGGVAIDPKKVDRFARPLATDLYAVKLMGRGLGHLAGVFGGVDLKSAEHDLERAVFIDPKCYEAQRLLGELYLAEAQDSKMPVRMLEAKAAGKFNYANDLAPDDVASLRGAAMAAAHASKHELALEMFKKLVTRRPWDIEARYQLGNAMWHTGDVAHAEKELDQVTAKSPDHLPARRVLVLIHASKSNTPKLVSELEAIAARLPDDLEVKADLASGYGALGQWAKATTALEAVAAARPPDLALLMRIGDGHRRSGELDAAIAWYLRAQRIAPQSSYPGFQIAQSLFDAGRLVEASRWYTLLQKYRYDIASAEEALGAIALIRGQPSDAAWYLRRAVREVPRSLITRRAAVAAELARKDVASAQDQLEPALAYWPEDGELHYLAGLAFALDGKRDAAHAQLATAVAKAPSFAPARAALALLDSGGTPALEYRPQVVRPWGDADAIAEALERYGRATLDMATARVGYQNRMLSLLGTLGLGPQPKKIPKQTAARVCPVGRLAPDWWAAQQQFYWLERAGLELEASYRFIMRHDEVGATSALLPNARTQVQNAKKSFRTAVSDASELRAEWMRGLGPELRAVGCYDKLLAAAVADPKRYQVIEEDQPDQPPAQQPPRAKPRATFYVDNTRCTDPVDVWIDGAQIGQVAPGRRSALVADGGERTLCLLGPGAAQCGDRGTLRQVYLHDGWSVTLYCPK